MFKNINKTYELLVKFCGCVQSDHLHFLDMLSRAKIDFKLVSKYQPAGDQKNAIDELTRLLQDRQSKAVLKGVTGSGKTYTMASVIQNLGRPALVLTHNKTLAAQLFREFKDYFPQRHRAPESFRGCNPCHFVRIEYATNYDKSHRVLFYRPRQ